MIDASSWWEILWELIWYHIFKRLQGFYYKRRVGLSFSFSFTVTNAAYKGYFCFSTFLNWSVDRNFNSLGYFIFFRTTHVRSLAINKSLVAEMGIALFSTRNSIPNITLKSSIDTSIKSIQLSLDPRLKGICFATPTVGRALEMLAFIRYASWWSLRLILCFSFEYKVVGGLGVHHHTLDILAIDHYIYEHMTLVTGSLGW